MSPTAKEFTKCTGIDADYFLRQILGVVGIINQISAHGEVSPSLGETYMISMVDHIPRKIARITFTQTKICIERIRD